MRASPATRSPRRCSPMACISSAARSNITGRAASFRPASRSPTRWSTIVRDRRASHAEPARDAGRTLRRARGAKARTAGPRSPSMSAPSTTSSRRCSRRLLLQDLHVAARCWKQRLRAAIRAAGGPRRAPTRPDPDRYHAAAMRIATCWCRRRPGRPRGGACRRRDRRARHALRRAGGARRLAARRDRAPRSMARRRRPGSPKPSRRSRVDDNVDAAAAHHGVRLLPAQFRRACRARHRPSRRSRPDLPRERLWQVRAKEVVIATGAIERPLVFPGNDRPGHHAGRCGARPIAIATAHGRAHARWSSPRTTAPIAAALDLAAAASRSPRSPTCARPEAAAGSRAAAGLPDPGRRRR